MGKTYLSTKELRQFPTLQKLAEGSKGYDKSIWGLCMNTDGDISFGEASPEWKLLINLENLFVCASYQIDFETNNAEDIILFYGVDFINKREISFCFLKINRDEGLLDEKLQIEWNYPEISNQK